MYLGTIDNTPKHRKYIWVFFLLAAGFCAFVFDYSLSRVTIKIYPKNTTRSTSLAFTLDQTVPNADPGKLIFPAKLVEREIATESDFSSSGKITHENFAQGNIVIQNKRDKEVSLPKGYKVLQGEKPIAGQPYRDKIIFALDNDISIPAGESLETTVTSTNKGLKGNIPPGPMYFASMAQWSRERIIPKNEKMFTGGIIEEPTVTGEDIDKARNELIKKAKKEISENLVSQLASDKTSTADLSYLYISEFSTSKQSGDVANDFKGRIGGNVKSLIYSPEEIKQVARRKLEEQSGELELISFDEPSINFLVKNYEPEQGKAEMELTLTGLFSPKFSLDIFEKKNLAGFNAQAIIQKYSTHPNIDKVEVAFFPFWRKSTPTLEDHVFIEIVK